MKIDEMVRAEARETALRVVETAQTVPAYLKCREAAAYLGLSRQFVEISRHRGNGPVYSKIGGQVRDRRIDLEAWMSQPRRRGTRDDEI